MGRTNLLSIPEEVLETILVKASNEDVRNLCASRMACKTLNQVGNMNAFYKELDLVSMTMRHWLDNAGVGIADVCQSCYAAENPSVIFLCGLSKFFRGHNLEGIAKLKIAADAGHGLASYIHEMTVLILSADEGGQVHHTPSLSRRHCYEMRMLLTELDHHVYDYNLPYDLYDASQRILEEQEWCHVFQRHDQWQYWWFHTADTSFLCGTDFWKLETRHFMSDFVEVWDVY